MIKWRCKLCGNEFVCTQKDLQNDIQNHFDINHIEEHIEIISNYKEAKEWIKKYY